MACRDIFSAAIHSIDNGRRRRSHSQALSHSGHPDMMSASYHVEILACAKIEVLPFTNRLHFFGDSPLHRVPFAVNRQQLQRVLRYENECLMKGRRRKTDTTFGVAVIVNVQLLDKATHNWMAIQCIGHIFGPCFRPLSLPIFFSIEL